MTYAAIAELAGLDQWVIYNSTSDKAPRRLNQKGDKLIGASHSEPSHWTGYDDAIRTAAAMAAAGVGFVFHESDPYSGIDLDGCRDPETGAIEDWALRIIEQANSYTEISPSGTGVKIFVRGKLPEALIVSFGEHTGIEVYSTARYFTVTGQHLAGTPTEIRDAQNLLDQLQREYKPKVEPTSKSSVKVLQMRPRAGRASLDDVKAQFLADHTLDSLLTGYGAVQTSAKDYSCPFCEHTHRNTLFTYNDRVFSRSPGCKIPQKRGLDAFGLYVLIEHNNDVVAAAKTLNPIEPRRRRQDPPLLEPEIRVQTSDQRADAQRKRETRRRNAAETIADVQARAGQDSELTKADRAVLDTLITVADGRDWCRPSKERIVAMCGYSLGTVKRSLMLLEARGYFTSQGAGGGQNQTAIRTFLRGSFLREMIHESRERVDLNSTIGTSERAPEAQPADWELWEACDSEACGYDLALETGLQTFENPIAEPIAVLQDAPAAEKVEIFPPVSTTVETEPDAGDASYSPQLDQTRKRRRSALPPKERDARAKARRQARLKAMDAPTLRREYIILSRKADKTTNPGQRYVLKEQVAEIEHYLALKDAELDRAMAPPVVQPPSQARPPQAGPLTLAMEFSQAPPAAAPDGWACIARLKQQRDQRQAVQ